MATPADFNEAFDLERRKLSDGINREVEAWRERVEAGEARYLGGGRYQVTVGLDKGEVFSVTRNGVMPEHGLDLKADGDAALYTRVPEWHGLGQVVPDGLSDIKEILRLCGGDYHVSKRGSYFVEAGDPRSAPGMFMTVRDDTLAPLGQVGGDYTVFQNWEAYDFLVELLASGALIAETAGVMRGGREFFICTRLPDDVIIDAEGINDQMIMYVVAIVRHDGKGSNYIAVTPWRPRCRNTERLAVSGAVTKWGFRHTRNIEERVSEARSTLRLTGKYTGQFVAEQEALARTTLAIDDFRAVIETLWPLEDDATGRTARNWNDRCDLLIRNYVSDPSVANCAGTAYAAERTVTDYLDHGKIRKPASSGLPSMAAARATALLEGADDDMKDKAHRLLMRTAVRRR